APTHPGDRAVANPGGGPDLRLGFRYVLCASERCGACQGCDIHARCLCLQHAEDRHADWLSCSRCVPAITARLHPDLDHQLHCAPNTTRVGAVLANCSEKETQNMATSAKLEARQVVKRVAARRHRDVLALSPTANTSLNLLLILFSILTLLPIYVIVISSLTSEASLAANGYRLWPEEFSAAAYGFLFSQGSIVVTAYKNTVISTVAGTVMSVVMVALYAYPLSRSNFKF